ncbi:MAG TPA: tRNA-dihydrouridine synthase family protein [bacterium]
MSEPAPAAGAFRPAALRIGSLSVFPPLVLAPMAGLTHAPLRRLLGELGGVGLFYSEMLSARALRHELPGRSRQLAAAERGRPLCLQIFAAEPEQIAPAVAAGDGWRPEVWDLNFGCPAPEILRQGAGGALARDLSRAWRMAEAMRQAVTGPLLFKIRAEEDGARLLEFARLLEAAGADGIVVHGRTAREKLCRPARWEPIAAVAAAVRIPVIGNGDVRSSADAERLLAETGCAGVMIGRAAAERPWIFREIAAGWGLPVPPLRLRTRSAVYRRLAKLLHEHLGHPRDLYRLREFTGYFAKNYKFGHQLWKEVQNAADVGTARRIAKDFFSRQEDAGETLA